MERQSQVCVVCGWTIPSLLIITLLLVSWIRWKAMAWVWGKQFCYCVFGYKGRRQEKSKTERRENPSPWIDQKCKPATELRGRHFTQKRQLPFKCRVKSARNDTSLPLYPFDLLSLFLSVPFPSYISVRSPQLQVSWVSKAHTKHKALWWTKANANWSSI